MNFTDAERLLRKCGQEHVLAHWKKLGKKDRDALLAQIAQDVAETRRVCAAAPEDAVR